jgi:hypothetical protein
VILPALQKPIVLAGRRFVPAGESTVEHDIEVMRLLRAAGIDAATADDQEEFAYRVLQALITNGTLLPLVACMIVPETHARRRPGMLVRVLERAGLWRRDAARGGWTPELQAETVAFLKDLDEPDDKNRVYAMVAAVLVPFLKGAPSSWQHSPRSPGSQDGAAPADGEPSPSAAGTTANGAG